MDGEVWHALQRWCPIGLPASSAMSKVYSGASMSILKSVSTHEDLQSTALVVFTAVEADRAGLVAVSI